MALARTGSNPALAGLLPPFLQDTPIAFGEVPPFLTDAIVRGVLYEASRSELLIDVPGTARIWVRREWIVVALLAAVEADRLGFFLRRTPLMAMMLLRGGLACNGAAVAGPDGAVLITGATASGKSTLAAALLKRGLRLLADDCAPILIDPVRGAMIAPVWPELLLWPSAVAGLFGSAPDWLRPGRMGGDAPCWAVDDSHFCRQAMPLKRVYMRKPNDDDEEEAAGELVGDLARMMGGALMPYQVEIAAALADPAALLTLHGAVGAAEPTEMIRLQRRDVREMEDLADRIVKDCGWS